MENLPIVPGRGILTPDALKMRQNYLQSLGFGITQLGKSTIPSEQIRNNIESYMGSVEVPLGLLGPLLFNENSGSELVYAAAATLEGALVASMNRGAKAISKSGGFQAAVLHQKMIRSPMFIFENLSQAMLFKKTVESLFLDIKMVAERYSNHAKLQEISPYIIGRTVHLKFIYTTGDASGQNMTTGCTWHAVLWLKQKFEDLTQISPVNFVLEGNGASDKKASWYSINQGRGIHVIAECHLDEKTIRRVLRTTSDDILRCFAQSQKINVLDGMMGNNINVANAIAAIFLATGQDMACVQESGIGIFNVEKTESGLYSSLNLPSLVVGTVGGGTHLPKQQEALAIMECVGSGKVLRFAKLIAGFALSLEMSTMAAIVGGHFAKAHEKMGRNKPKDWLTKAEITTDFVKNCLVDKSLEMRLQKVELSKLNLIENGILINLTSKVNKKLTGFVNLSTDFGQGCLHASEAPERMLLKSKPLDNEVFIGLHLMASSIDPILADLISKYAEHLEYKNCHIKEIQLYHALSEAGFEAMPEFFGSQMDCKREVYVFLTELLEYNELLLINSENAPEKWTPDLVKSALTAIHEAHTKLGKKRSIELAEISEFDPISSMELYQKMSEIILSEYQQSPLEPLAARLFDFIEDVQRFDADASKRYKKTIIHNDFNPRNIAVRKSGQICIYDWELAVVDYPQRDIVEFLSFVLPEDFSEKTLMNYITFYQKLNPQSNHLLLLAYSAKAYLLTRVSFYLTGKILMEYEFAERIFKNTIRMIDIFEKQTI